MSTETREFYPETRAMVGRRAIVPFHWLHRMLSMRSADNFGGGSAIASSHADQITNPRGIMVTAVVVATAGIATTVNYLKNRGS